MPSNVSIGMPVYNGARWVARTIESVLAQTRGDFELIVSDGASTDDTLAIVERYASRDARVRVLRQVRNHGAAANWNAVFHASSGRFFKWQSSNDLVAPEYLERTVGVLERRDDLIGVYTLTGRIDEFDHVVEVLPETMDLERGGPVERLVEYERGVRLNNVEQGLYRREVLARTPLMAGIRSDDTILVSELALRGRIALVREPLFLRRHVAGAITVGAKDPQRVAQMYRPGQYAYPWQEWRYAAACLKLLSSVDLPADEQRRLRRHVFKSLRWSLPDLMRDVVVSAPYMVSWRYWRSLRRGRTERQVGTAAP
jgi:glycosyltransferase involved in cell wall biosynthesis